MARTERASRRLDSKRFGRETLLYEHAEVPVPQRSIIRYARRPLKTLVGGIFRHQVLFRWAISLIVIFRNAVHQFTDSEYKAQNKYYNPSQVARVAKGD